LITTFSLPLHHFCISFLTGVSHGFACLREKPFSLYNNSQRGNFLVPPWTCAGLLTTFSLFLHHFRTTFSWGVLSTMFPKQEICSVPPRTCAGLLTTFLTAFLTTFLTTFLNYFSHYLRITFAYGRNLLASMTFRKGKFVVRPRTCAGLLTTFPTAIVHFPNTLSRGILTGCSNGVFSRVCGRNSLSLYNLPREEVFPVPP